MKKLLCALFALGAAVAFAADAPKNLIVNGELKINEKGRLTGWEYPRKNSFILNNDNTIGLKEGFQGYSSYWVTRAPVKPFVSYKLEFEYKAENIGKMAGVYYIWSDAEGKKLANERFALKLNPGSTDGWVKCSQVLSQSNPVKTARLNICFALYNASGEGKIFFRNISLTAVGGDSEEDDDDTPPAAAPAKPAAPEKKK